MIKVIDVDQLFDKYISDYVYSNIGKVNPEEIENKIAQLYVEFGKTALKELNGKTPEQFYEGYSGKELLNCLREHLASGVAVSDFLCEAITKNPDHEDALVEALSQEQSEEFILYVMNMLGERASKKPAKRYLEFILWDFSESVRELATELLKDMADTVKEDILREFAEADQPKKACLTEVLSCCEKDDRVFDILVAEFAKNQKNIPIYAGYLAKYGDDRALPFLLASIEREKISYADFEELRFAIEALGGEYNKERDFSLDKSYKKIKNTQNK